MSKIIEHRTIMERLLDEAHLLFTDDKPLINCLHEIRNDYLSLSEKFIDLTQKACSFSPKALAILSAEFPELQIQGRYNLDKILNHPLACKRFDELFATLEYPEFTHNLKMYKRKFSYENFDTLFKKHLIDNDL